MGGLTYLSNRDLAIDTAHEAMRQSSRQIVSGVGQHIARVTRVASAPMRADAGTVRGSRNMLIFRCFPLSRTLQYCHCLQYYWRWFSHSPYIPHIAGGIFRQLSGGGMRGQRGVR